MQKRIFLLERTKEATSSIIGLYNSEDRAVAAIKRLVNEMIDEHLVKAKVANKDLMGVYISEGFLITCNHMEVDPEVAFEKIEDAEEFPEAEVPYPNQFKADPITHHLAEDLGDVKDLPHDERGWQPE